MAGFLRKKRPQSAQEPQPKIISPPYPSSASNTYNNNYPTPAPAAPTSPPPLFSRFASTAQSSSTTNVSVNGNGGARMVSGPMALTGRPSQPQSQQQMRAQAMASTNSFVTTTGGREAESARRRTQEYTVNGGGGVGGVGGAYNHNHNHPPLSPSGQMARANVNVRLSLDKALPSPIVNGFEPPSSYSSAPAAAAAVSIPLNSTSNPHASNPNPINAAGATVARRVTAQGPPPSFAQYQQQQQQLQQLHTARSRASLDVRDLENKPLPRPGVGAGVGSSNWQEPPSSLPPPPPNGKGPPATYKFTPKTPPKRYASVGGGGGGANQNGLRMNGNGNSNGITNRMSMSAASTSASTRRVENGNGNGNANTNANGNGNGANGNGKGYGGAGTGTGTPMSDRVDLPPEFALFQEFSETLSISTPTPIQTPLNGANTPLPPPPQKTTTTTIPPPRSDADSLKSADQVPGSSQQRSSIYREDLKSLEKPQPALPPNSNPTNNININNNNTNINADDSPPLPPPPPKDIMSVSTSHALPNDILMNSSYKNIYSPQMTRMNAASNPNANSTTYDYAGHAGASLNGGGNVIQQQSAYHRRFEVPAGVGAAVLPANANANANGYSASSPMPVRSLDLHPGPAGTSTNSYTSVGADSNFSGGLQYQHQHQYQYQRPPPQQQQPLQPLVQQQQVRDLQPFMGQSASVPAPILRKSPSVSAATSPMKGKPRIFAAMESQEGGGVESVESAVPPPPPQREQYQQPQSTPYHHQQPPLPQQQQQQYQQQYYQQQGRNQPQELLPSVDLFSTPRSRIDSLPHDSSFVNASHNHTHTDPRSSDAASTYSTTNSNRTRTPSSPKKASLPPTFLQQQQQSQQAHFTPRTPKSSGSRSLSRGGDESVPRQQFSPQSTPAAGRSPRKLSKSRAVHKDTASVDSLSQFNGSSSTSTIPGTPESHSSKILVHQHANGHRTLAKSRPTTPNSTYVPLMEPVPVHVDNRDSMALINGDGTSALVDDDPFARVEGVKMLKPVTPPPPKEGSIKRQRTKDSKGASVDGVVSDDVAASIKEKASLKSQEGTTQEVEEPRKTNGVSMPMTPVSPEDFRQWRRERSNSNKDRGDVAPDVDQPTPTAVVPEDETPHEPFTLAKFTADPHLLESLLVYLTFYDWCVYSAVSKEIRILLVRTPTLREVVLNSYLKTVGYARWTWDDKEPLTLSLQDLSDYMRGVSTPTHEYARVAAMHIHSLTIHPNHRDPSLIETVRALTASARAYNRVVLRLRAQAEKEASVLAATQSHQPPPPSSTTSLTKVANGNYSSPSRPGTASRPPSRAPSPSTSMYSYSPHGNASANGHASSSVQQSSSQNSLSFRSPLFRLRRAPLLRVFVPSPEGDWLSDKSVLECEAECKRAGIIHLMRLGDVVWDVAVGDEGNVGRLVWDGSYIIDLDYTYSTIGDLPKYLPTLAFPPSYFHRVIRTGANTANPIVHIDISPWGEEIAMNLQLLQDRVRTETPQGAYHNVVRWVHRSSFSIRPQRGPPRYMNTARLPINGRIPIPDSNNLFVDSGWYGTIVVETEGTNEALADLQDRCGPGAFPPRSRGVSNRVTQAQIENRKVFRILRERSRPGEIWIRAVGVKERLL